MDAKSSATSTQWDRTGLFIMTNIFSWNNLIFNNFREKVLWEERMKTKEELVKRREEAVRMAEIEYNQKLQDEIRK